MRESRAYHKRGGTGRDVDKVSALRGSIDTRRSITNLPEGTLPYQQIYYVHDVPPLIGRRGKDDWLSRWSECIPPLTSSDRNASQGRTSKTTLIPQDIGEITRNEGVWVFPNRALEDIVQRDALE